jgi:hypothetical protein
MSESGEKGNGIKWNDNKSMVACDEVETADLEAGPNSCGIKT